MISVGEGRSSTSTMTIKDPEQAKIQQNTELWTQKLVGKYIVDDASAVSH